MRTFCHKIWSLVLVCFLGLAGFAQQQQSDVELGNISEVRFKPFVYINCNDEVVRDYLEKRILENKNGRLVPVTSAASADLVIAFVPKTITNSDPAAWPSGLVGSNAKDRLIVYTRPQGGKARLIWFNQAGKKSEDAIKDFLKALDADHSQVKDPAKSLTDFVNMEDSSQGTIVKPVITHKVRAVYPVNARIKNVQGIVVVSVVFGLDKKLRDFRVIRGLPYGLTAAAIQAALKIQFQPAKRDDKEIEIRVNLEFLFGLY